LGVAEAAIARVDDEGRVKRRASPVVRPLEVKIDLAKVLGLTIPPSILGRADDVIE
jgi:hypothetical protein